MIDWLSLNSDATCCLKDSIYACTMWWFKVFCMYVSLLSNLTAKSILFWGPPTMVCFELIGLLWNPTDSAHNHSFRFDSVPDVSVLVSSSHFNLHWIYVWKSVSSISFPDFFSRLTVFCGPITACTYFCVNTNHISRSMCLSTFSTRLPPPEHACSHPILKYHCNMAELEPHQHKNCVLFIFVFLGPNSTCH